jgi:adenylyltransferase/sulfurtransferase
VNDEQLLRYSRQIMLPQVDVAGQEKILNAQVLVVGLGGLGCPVAMYLAAAGVGHLVLADFDEVDLTNLQRQIAHHQSDIGRPKVESARDKIHQLNPATQVTALHKKLDEAELEQQVAAADIVVDCTDNFSIRHAINRACVTNTTPLVSGAAIRLEGQVAVFDPRREGTPCYRCLYALDNDENLSCSESGVLAPLVGIIGSVQALEALKLLADFGEPLAGKLLLLDATTMEWRSLKLPRDPACPVCGDL